VTDIVDAATRSRMMSGIRGTNTRIEIAVRKALFARGFRYRINAKGLPGKPDLLLKKYGAVVFVHGCYWHGHSCSLFKLPASNREFWQTKIEGNRDRDDRNMKALREQGWRIATVWECTLRGKGEIGLQKVTDRLAAWLESEEKTIEIKL
jgi:DNA mismatch endonuclease, patch repair protein